MTLAQPAVIDSLLKTPLGISGLPDLISYNANPDLEEPTGYRPLTLQVS